MYCILIYLMIYATTIQFFNLSSIVRLETMRVHTMSDMAALDLRLFMAASYRTLNDCFKHSANRSTI